MTGQAWYLELIRQGYSQERAHLRAFGVLITVAEPEPEVAEPMKEALVPRWWPSEDDIYDQLGSPLEMMYGPKE